MCTYNPNLNFHTVFISVHYSSDTDDLETQEILEEQLTRQLTREYIDLLGMDREKVWLGIDR